MRPQAPRLMDISAASSSDEEEETSREDSIFTSKLFQKLEAIHPAISPPYLCTDDDLASELSESLTESHFFNSSRRGSDQQQTMLMASPVPEEASPQSILELLNSVEQILIPQKTFIHRPEPEQLYLRTSTPSSPSIHLRSSLQISASSPSGASSKTLLEPGPTVPLSPLLYVRSPVSIATSVNRRSRAIAPIDVSYCEEIVVQDAAAFVDDGEGSFLHDDLRSNSPTTHSHIESVCADGERIFNLQNILTSRDSVKSALLGGPVQPGSQPNPMKINPGDGDRGIRQRSRLASWPSSLPSQEPFGSVQTLVSNSFL